MNVSKYSVVLVALIALSACKNNAPINNKHPLNPAPQAAAANDEGDAAEKLDEITEEAKSPAELAASDLEKAKGVMLEEGQIQDVAILDAKGDSETASFGCRHDFNFEALNIEQGGFLLLGGARVAYHHDDKNAASSFAILGCSDGGTMQIPNGDEIIRELKVGESMNVLTALRGSQVDGMRPDATNMLIVCSDGTASEKLTSANLVMQSGTSIALRDHANGANLLLLCQ